MATGGGKQPAFRTAQAQRAHNARCAPMVSSFESSTGGCGGVPHPPYCVALWGAASIIGIVTRMGEAVHSLRTACTFGTETRNYSMTVKTRTSHEHTTTPQITVSNAMKKMTETPHLLRICTCAHAQGSVEVWSLAPAPAVSPSTVTVRPAPCMRSVRVMRQCVSAADP